MGCHTVLNKTAPLLAIGLFLISLGVVGTGGVGWALNDPGPLQIDQERVSGTVTQLPLRSILDQFHEQLGIDYRASKEELAKPVSVALHQASIQQALEKILATWNYALTKNQAGYIQHIFVLQKILAGGAEEKTIQAEAGRSLTPHSRDERDPRAAVEEAEMGIIPPTDHPDLDITPMSEGEQQGIVEALESATGESFNPELDITPMSDEEQQAIIQSMESAQ